MEYPRQTKIHAMIELIIRELEKAYEQGESELRVGYIVGGQELGIERAIELPKSTLSSRNWSKTLPKSFDNRWAS